MNKNSIKYYLSGYGHSLRLFPVNDDREKMVRFFGEYVNARASSHDEVLREQFKRIGQRLWTAIKTLPPQGEEVEKLNVVAKVYGSDRLECQSNEGYELFNETSDLSLGKNKHTWLRWRGKVPDFDESIEFPEEEHVR